MRKYRGFTSALVLLTLVSLNGAQATKMGEAELFPSAAPQLLWQYDTGG